MVLGIMVVPKNLGFRAGEKPGADPLIFTIHRLTLDPLVQLQCIILCPVLLEAVLRSMSVLHERWG